MILPDIVYYVHNKYEILSAARYTRVKQINCDSTSRMYPYTPTVTNFAVQLFRFERVRMFKKICS